MERSSQHDYALIFNVQCSTSIPRRYVIFELTAGKISLDRVHIPHDSSPTGAGAVHAPECEQCQLKFLSHFNTVISISSSIARGCPSYHRFVYPHIPLSTSLILILPINEDRRGQRRALTSNANHSTP